MARGQNRHANSLATLASIITEDVPRLIKVELIMEPSINDVISVGVAGVDVEAISTIRSCWMDSIIDFLAEDRIPNNEKEANRVRWMVAWCWLSADRKLYWRSFGGPYLLCLRPEKVNKLLTELHDEVCDSHVGGHSLAH